MKTQISRDSLNLEKRYSGVYQQQGRMLTDADWNELNELLKHRLKSISDDAVKSGSPRNHGIVDIIDKDADNRSYALKWGNVFVDGIHAEITPAISDDVNNPDSQLFEYQNQEDFPQAPALPETDYKLYLDVWERTVTSNEDQNLLDPGLHGADTCTRTQTMAQVKWCDPGFDPEDPLQNPAKGDALLSLQLMRGTEDKDLCDPCSVEFDVNKRVGNYLFRVEVHDVTYHAGSPERVTLKWSSENGAEEYKAGMEPLGFRSGGWLYEFFSGDEASSLSEKHHGFHPNGMTPVRGELYTRFPEITPPGFSMVRRWDGYVLLEKQADSSWLPVADTVLKGCDKGITLSPTSDINAPAHITTGREITINLDSIFLRIDLNDKILLAGDYWIAAVRESIHEQGDWILSDAEPSGIEHHYMTIVTTDSNRVSWQRSPWDDEKLRKLRFPPLSDLNAEDIAYKMPSCNLLPQGQIGVRDMIDGLGVPGDSNASLQQILDTILCHLNATTLPIDKNSDLCPSLEGDEVQSVQDAINRLCVLEAGSCSTYTVHSRKDWEEVFEEIREIDNVHICFRNGEFNLSDTIVIKNKKNIKISGCGGGSHIRCHAKETVFRFEECEAVTIENIFAESGRTGFSGNSSGLNGTITAINCKKTAIENNICLCAAGVKNSASCITIRNGSEIKGFAKIKSNELNCGHYQTGILLVNVDRSIIEENNIHTRPMHGTISFHKQLDQSRRFRAQLRKYMIKNAVLSDFSNDSAYDDRVVILQIKNRHIEFYSDLSDQNEWEDMVAAYIGDKSVGSNQKLLEYTKEAAEKILIDEEFRKKYRHMDEWYKKMKSNNPAIVLNGVIVAGQRAGEVMIRNNSLRGVAEAVRVALSDKNNKGCHCGILRIKDNNIHGVVPPFHHQSHQIVFVGNCRHLLYENNHTTVQRRNDNRLLSIEGLRIRGVIGRMMVIRQNYLANCDCGICVDLLNQETETLSQWVVSDNIAPFAANAVVARSEKVKKSGNLA